MKKNSKVIGMTLILAAFALMSLGSGSSSSTAKETKAITQEKTESKAAAAETAAEADKADETTESAAAAETESATEAAQDAITIEEQLLVDQEGLKITAKEYTVDPIWGPGLKLLIENDSDKNYGVSCNALIVNNYMVSDLFSKSVAPGKKANETINFLSADLKNAGIDTPGQIEIYFHVFDADSYETLFDPEGVTIKTSAYDSMDVIKLDDGQELYNEDGLRIVGKYVDENSLWGTAVLLYIENNTGKNVGVQASDMSINGFMVTPFFSSTVYDGKMALDDITIMQSDLEANDIETVEDVELKFHIFDVDSYSTIKDTDPITFSAK